MTRKSYRVFSLREMAKASTGETRRALLDMASMECAKSPFVEEVLAGTKFGQILIGLGAKVGEKVVIEE